MQILSAKYIVNMVHEPIVGGAVAVEGGEIVDVGRESELVRRYPMSRQVDFPHHAILPGLINCHTHLDMSFYKDYHLDPVRQEGVTVNFVDWLLGCIQHKKKSTSAMLREAVQWAVDECHQSGTTCVADMSSYEGVFSVLEQKRLRAVVFPEVLSIGHELAKDFFETAMAMIEKYSEQDSPFISVGAGPYSPYLLSRNLLRIISQYCRTSQIPVMIHAAESFSEMEFFHNSSGDIAAKLFPNIGWDELPPEHKKTPIQHLSQIGFLDTKPLLVGCTQLSGTDLNHIAQTGSRVVITSRSHMNLQQGKAPFHEMRQRHILTVLGTDGIPSVNNLSLWDEMRAFVQQHNDVVHLSGQDVLSMVTSHAAMALGFEEEIGTLEKGKKADLIVVNAQNVPFEGDFLMNLIQNTTNYHIENVMIGGKYVKTVN